MLFRQLAYIPEAANIIRIYRVQKQIHNRDFKAVSDFKPENVCLCIKLETDFKSWHKKKKPTSSQK